MLTPVEKLIFAFAVIATAYNGYFAYRSIRGVIARGQGKLDTDRLPRRAWRAATEWIGLGPTWRARPLSTFFHAFIAWCFMFYLFVNVGDVIGGYYPVEFMGDGWVGDLYRLLADVLSVAALTGMVYFLLRRFVYRDKALSFRANVKLVDRVRAGGLRRDSLIVGVFILLHVGARFLGQSFEMALAGRDPFQPFASAASTLWAGMSTSALVIGAHVMWWLALGLILAFVPYFPYTKHLHLILSGFNFLTKPKRTSPGALDPIPFDDETVEQFGVARLEDLPQTQILDAFACIMCNRCQDACPAYVTGKELSPAALEINKRYFINENMHRLAAGEASIPLLDYALSESALWACTACGACVEVCPVGNEPMFDIIDMRRNQVLMESAFPEQLQTAFTGMERAGNPWKLSAADRMKWATDLHVPTIDENPDAEILWWVGCAPAYDARAQNTARAFAKVLNAAGVSFAVLGERESCTGDAARRAGNEYLFFEMAKQNIETLNAVNPKRIVATCPHCMHTLGKEYGQYGGNYNVIHHTQLIAELMTAGRLTAGEWRDGAVTYHDPCYLGRQNGIFDAPRDVLTNIVGGVIELERSRNKSFCCGAGGAQMWKEEEPGAAAINMTRYQEAAATGAGTIAVGCPFCLTMLTDASKQAGEGVQVKDVVELVAETL